MRDINLTLPVNATSEAVPGLSSLVTRLNKIFPAYITMGGSPISVHLVHNAVSHYNQWLNRPRFTQVTEIAKLISLHNAMLVAIEQFGDVHVSHEGSQYSILDVQYVPVSAEITVTPSTITFRKALWSRLTRSEDDKPCSREERCTHE